MLKLHFKIFDEATKICDNGKMNVLKSGKILNAKSKFLMLRV